MKLAIITIHFPYNYGAMLQAYALKEFLKTHSYNCDIVDYRPYFIDHHYHLYKKDIFTTPLHFFRLFKQHRSEKFKNFDLFLTKDIQPKKMNSLMDCNSQYELMITGSDQIWNPEITNHDLNYFLDFLNESSNVKKIAYASSVATKNISQAWLDTMANQLNDFAFIGVREIQAKELFKKIMPKKDVTLVADPTFLLSKEKWQDISEKPKQFTFSKYVLLYTLQKNEELNKKTIAYSKKYGIPIVEIHPFSCTSNCSDMQLTNIGPKQFLWLIDNAECIFTNSFHGTAFSVIFNKKFVTISHTITGSRMDSLLQSIGLDNINNDECYQMNKINQKMLKRFIKDSQNVLLQNVSK